MQLNAWCTICDHTIISCIVYATAKFQTLSSTFGNDANFVNRPGAADIKIQSKSPKFLLDMRHFCNFSLVSIGIRPRSRRYAERTRQGEGRWSRPPKAALERSYSTENSSSANRILGPRRKKLLIKSKKPKNDFIYIYMYETGSVCLCLLCIIRVLLACTY